ncbi:hypothetical protein [Mycobacterium sp. IDR2000157661]|uniref:hypothetical protein n=1 Tax=Mycobacterium sp. IDR2000157661 TaxID=2867005 RepID=UPI001EEAEE18|nr:hypothetical protein [Mycobacterium sp. IDR2000157661]ULE33058.1 hypothetical protein K3G64_23880 [Mycobacterium sp. IDR2000157661]
MATRPFPADAVVNYAAADAGRLNRHQLTVLAASPAEVVQVAGGWLFDQARAGWDVNVRVAGPADRRPLTILGAGALGAECETLLSGIPDTGAVAVTAELLRIDVNVRAWLLDSVKRAGAKITVLGSWPAELGGPLEPARHQLSVAAQAFKVRALAAAAVDGGVTATETLYEVRAQALRPLYPV